MNTITKLIIIVLICFFTSPVYSQTIKYTLANGDLTLYGSVSWEQVTDNPAALLMVVPKVPLHTEDFSTNIQVKSTEKESPSIQSIRDLKDYGEKKILPNAATLKIKEGSNISAYETINGVQWWSFECVFDYGKKFPPVKYKQWQTLFNGKVYSLSLNAPVTNFQYSMPVAELMMNTIIFTGTDDAKIKAIENRAAVFATDIPPTPKIIDYGEIDDFHECFAVARRGDDYTIIDTLGNEKVPIGKYVMINHRPDGVQLIYSGFINGMCLVQDKNTMLYGFLDTNFTLAIPCVYNTVTLFQKDGYALVTQVDEKKGTSARYYIDKKGKRYINRGATEDEFLVWEFTISPGNITEKQYYRKNGTSAFKIKESNSKFSDAMSRISQNFNGTNRYGFIDTSGKQVISPKFSGEISDFSEGLALYKPNFSDVYKYSYVDKKGNEVFRLNVSDSLPNLFDLTPFRHGYANFAYYLEPEMSGKNRAIVDKQGKVIILEKLFKRAVPGFEEDSPDKKYNEHSYSYIGRSKHLIFFNYPYYYNLNPLSPTSKLLYKNYSPDINYYNSNKPSAMGAMNYNGEIVIPPVFKHIGVEDPVSGYVKAGFGSPYNSNSIDQCFLNSRGQIILKLKTPYEDFRRSSMTMYNSTFNKDF